MMGVILKLNRQNKDGNRGKVKKPVINYVYCGLFYLIQELLRI